MKFPESSSDTPTQPNSLDARGVRDLTDTIAAINKGEKGITLTRSEIQTLATINAETVSKMKDQLKKESSAPRYQNESESDEKARINYWKNCEAELDAVIQNYKTGLENIKTGTQEDIAKLKDAHDSILGISKSKEAVAYQPGQKIDLAGGIPERAQKFGVKDSDIALLNKYGLNVTFQTESKNTNDRIDIQKEGDDLISFINSNGDKGRMSSMNLISNRSNEPLNTMKVEEISMNGKQVLFVEFSPISGSAPKRSYYIPASI